MVSPDQINEVCKSLYKMNIVCLIISILFFGSSVFYAVSMGLEHGFSYEVIQIIEGVEKVTIHYTLFNVAMSMMFLFMMLTAFISFTWTFLLSRSWEGRLKLEEL